MAEAYYLSGQPEQAIQGIKEAMRLNLYYPNWWFWPLGFAQ
jgi:hypothetical protein